MHRTGLVLLLLPLLEGAAAAVAAPPQCPWEPFNLAVLAPQFTSPQQPLARNGSLFVRWSPGVEGSFSLLQPTTGSTVAIDVIVHAIGNSSALYQIRPRGLLAANANFELQQSGVPVPGGTVVTGTITDDAPPPPPVVEGVVPITSAYDPCQASGFIVSATPGPGSDAVLHLVESEGGGELLAVDPLSNRIGVPFAENSSTRIRVVDMDIAGHRSDASAPLTAMSAGTPQVMGKDPFFPPDGGNSSNNGNGSTREPGCDCSATRSAGGPEGLLGLLLGLGACRIRRHAPRRRERLRRDTRG